MSKKFYRVKKDTFLWKAGAILENSIDNGRGYTAVEDVWNATDALGNEYISAKIIESPDSAEWFERVYPDTIVGAVYRTKDQLKEMYEKAFK